jgi:ADP-ribose pyrophosphatase
VSDSDPKFLSAKEAFRSVKFTVMEEKFSLPTGETVDRAKLYHTGAAVVVPQLKDGRLVLVDQYRYSIRKRILEFPAGTIDHQEPHLETAKRELKEEIGGESDNFQHLGSDYTTPGFTDELIHTYYASNVSLGPTALERGELAEAVVMSVQEVESAIKSGKIQDMKSIVAFYKARLAGLI